MTQQETVFANIPLVIDNGSGMIKVGLAGDITPKCLFPSYVGKVKYMKVMAGGLEGDTFVGEQAEKNRGLLKLQYPMEHGVIKNWEDMERIWHYIYSTLKIQREEHPVLLTEPPLNPTSNREKNAEIFFETFGVPALYISLQAVLSLYSSGRTTGIVLDSGDGVTHAVPIFEGFAIPHAISRIDLAGRDVTKHLQLLLRKAGYSFTTSSEFEIVRYIKENACEISENLRKDQEIEFEKKTQQLHYRLPDGNEITIRNERFMAAEILFNPEIIGSEDEGIHQILENSIRRTDLDLRSQLYKNIVLSGGNTLFRGFGDRLLNELKEIAPKEIKLSIYAPKERKFSTWIGGSILASLNTFKKMLVTNREYDEYGPKIINRKCF
ncbi:alpha-centractin [Anaeramoeba flamelloides]|uniref:Alpha-centractin n=1 Tax=Anaeramoeba flamelloides TaxID=1746091 RepID=A0AAV7YNY7_9EUKA|nr:alpha-centractin [Anaeramoeba flamelloides]